MPFLLLSGEKYAILNLVKEATAFRIGENNSDFPISLFEIFGYSCECAASACSTDKRIDEAVGLDVNLWSSGVIVYLLVVQIFELIGEISLML